MRGQDVTLLYCGTAIALGSGAHCPRQPSLPSTMRLAPRLSLPTPELSSPSYTATSCPHPTPSPPPLPPWTPSVIGTHNTTPAVYHATLLCTNPCNPHPTPHLTPAQAAANVGVMVRELRSEMDRLLGAKIQDPELDLGSNKIVAAVEELLSTDGF